MSRRLIPLAIAALIAAAPGAPRAEESPSLIEQGAKLFLKGILEEMEPALDDLQGLTDDLGPALRGLVDEMGPALVELLGKIEDFSAYHPPEILPNGDIIIRRKTPQDRLDAPRGEIDI